MKKAAPVYLSDAGRIARGTCSRAERVRLSRDQRTGRGGPPQLLQGREVGRRRAARRGADACQQRPQPGPRGLRDREEAPAAGALHPAARHPRVGPLATAFELGSLRMTVVLIYAAIAFSAIVQICTDPRITKAFWKSLLALTVFCRALRPWFFGVGPSHIRGRTYEQCVSARRHRRVVWLARARHLGPCAVRSTNNRAAALSVSRTFSA
jgi:hypothetical protein